MGEATMTAADVLAALRKHHDSAALVPEVVITDDFPVWAELESGHKQPYVRRIDALMFDALERTAIEIKVSKADAAKETYNKVKPWWQVVHRFVYAVPAGLIEHPPIWGCGLWWVHDNGRVEVKRKARVSKTPEPLPQSVVQALAFRAVGKQQIKRRPL